MRYFKITIIVLFLLTNCNDASGNWGNNPSQNSSTQNDALVFKRVNVPKENAFSILIPLAYKPGVVVSVDENSELETVPNSFSLSQNYPNPFNPTTIIKFTVPHHGGQANVGNENVRSVQLKVYDVLGNEITTLVNEAKTTGTYEVEFDGSKLSSGVYFYKLSTEKFHQVKKMLLIK